MFIISAMMVYKEQERKMIVGGNNMNLVLKYTRDFLFSSQ